MNNQSVSLGESQGGNGEGSLPAMLRDYSDLLPSPTIYFVSLFHCKYTDSVTQGPHCYFLQICKVDQGTQTLDFKS